MKKKRIIYISAIVLFAIVALIVGKSCSSKNLPVKVDTETISKGAITTSVTATGTLEAILTVEVGTQVSGVIEKIYVDFNTEVKKGQLLAKLDETPLMASLEQSKASVDQAEAEVKYQKSNYERTKALLEKELIAQSDFDLAEFNYKKSEATLINAKSVYEKNRINLSYARIYSPIDGVVLDRAVDEGQTVAASFSTPTLFSIANDLTQMQVEANVDEADIGQVKMGQRVEFTVDAFSDRKFEGKVTEIRIKPVETSNVITYTVIINAPNPEKKLLPGMTASTTIFVKELKDVLVVTGKALRFTPEQAVMEAYIRSVAKPDSRPESPLAGNSNDQPTPFNGAVENGVWVKQGEMIHRVPVKLGETDGINFELKEGLKEGDVVVVSMAQEKQMTAPTQSAKSPFMPQGPRR
jgi:HlyD family secretion protein